MPSAFLRCCQVWDGWMYVLHNVCIRHSTNIRSRGRTILCASCEGFDLLFALSTDGFSLSTRSAHRQTTRDVALLTCSQNSTHGTALRRP